MTQTLRRLWWRFRVDLVWMKGRVLHLDVRERLGRMAMEAASRYDYREFMRIMDLAGGVSDWSPAWVAITALVYYDMGRIVEAERHITIALEKEPLDPTVLSCYGEYLQKKGAFQDSIEYLDRAAAAIPADARTWALLGHASRMLGQWDKARQYYLRGVGCRPGTEQLANLFDGLGHAAAQLGEWREAARYWREATAGLPRDECVWYNLGDALLHAGDYQGAIEPLTRSLRMGSGRPAWTLYDMASAYYHLGHMRQAKVFCERALRHEPNDPVALELLREVQRLSGK